MAAAALCACDTSATTQEPGEAARAIGIDGFSIAQTEESVSIEGLDQAGTTVARLDLVHGLFLLEEQEELGAVAARRLILNVKGMESTHTSRIVDRVTLPVPMGNNAAGAFVHDPIVVTALARWDVAFEALHPIEIPPLLDETPYLYPGYVNCTQPYIKLTYQSPNNSGRATCAYDGCSSSATQGCRQWNAGTYGGLSQKGEYRCCTSLSVAERRCTAANQGTSCGTAGGGGCKPCWTLPYGPTSAYCSVGPTQPSASNNSTHMEFCTTELP